jgi:uncharacterized delta-60 repeat protein
LFEYCGNGKWAGGFMIKYKPLFAFAIALCSFLPAFLYAQVDTAWVRRYNGPGNSNDYAYAIAVDGQGNVYVTGTSTGSGTNFDYATIKYNSAGIEQWIQRYNGPGNNEDWAFAITADGSGSVYVTGYSYGSGTGEDYATVKYNTVGVEQWVARYNGPGNSNDEACSIVADSSGNVYVTGYTYGLGTYHDYATIKYNSAGVEQWVVRYNGPGNSTDDAHAIAVDDAGNVYVTGVSRGSDANDDYTTIKYNSNGVEQWVQRYNGPANSGDYARAIAIDDAGNVYVTGYSYSSSTGYDYATIKYDSNGIEQWVARYNGPANSGDYVYAIAADGSGNVYVTGYSYGSGTGEDYATIKYNSAGETLWVRRYNGPGNDDDEARAIAIDGSGNVYITGFNWGSGALDYATIKYNSAGVEQWFQGYNGPANDVDAALAIAVDVEENVYVTGGSAGSGTEFDYATIKYMQTPGVEEIATLPLAMTQGFDIYPNPAKSYFAIRIPQMLNQVQHDMEVKIFDVTGKMVKEILNQVQNDNTMRVSLNGIKNGVYFVKIGEELVKEKLVVTR